MQISSSISDDALRTAVQTALTADERTASLALRLGVMNGIVHLAGMVDSLAIRSAAEEIAIRVEGVCGVVNRIEAPGAPEPSRKIQLNLKKHAMS